jgi:NAD(P)-dependent dehydrogenase (short-subunit alcohol dehydrogenase family)
MRDLSGKTAFITGGASGIGLGMARAFAGAGANLVLADIEEAALAQARAEFDSRNVALMTVRCDVADRASVIDAAGQAIEQFERIHILCNNAGVGAGGVMGEIPAADWNWVLGVNLMGVIHGIDALLPHMRAHGEDGHVVNTASMAGMAGVAGMGPYCASKFAVVALSEGLSQELQGSNIGVSVLCPGWVNTSIIESGRNRPVDAPRRPIDPDDPRARLVRDLIENGLSIDTVGERVLEAVHDNELYVFTHPDMRQNTEERFQRILAGFDRAAQSPALAGTFSEQQKSSLFQRS